MNGSGLTALGGIAVALAAIGATTAAVVTGHISGEAFVGIVTAFGGIGAGAGVHASGVNSAPTVTTTAGPPPTTTVQPQ